VISSGLVQYHADLEKLLRPIDSVQAHPANFNNGNVEGIMDSIMASGMYRPVFVQKSTGYIVAGNHTYYACLELGAEQIPVVELDISDLAAKKLMIADNEYAKQAKYDNGQLVTLLEELKMDDTLLGTGFGEADLLELQALNDMPLEDVTEHRMWPTLCFQIPPHVKRKFYEMTERAGGDNERFQLMLRLAGWDGKK
jgi:ParB-like chromosome segregation protein Spo0J